MSSLDIELPFGADGRWACSVAAERVLLYHRAPQALKLLTQRVRERLTSPLDFPALSQAVLPDDRIVIALDQQTPGAASLIRGCWDVLDSVGVDPQSILILQPGSAADATALDPRCELPESVAEQIQLTRHDAQDTKNLAYLASTTSGERIYLARELIDADFVLCAGAIAYDPLLGYRGTSSVLYPGLSSDDAIRKSRGQGHDELGPDDVRGLRQTIDEVGWLLGVQFALQVVPAGRRGVADVITGSC
ncbi:MAG: lactate racemase domain-containing protein, partial [Planctomycetaceae bacterium]